MSVRVCMHMGDGRQKDVNCEYLVVNFFLFFFPPCFLPRRHKLWFQPGPVT